MKQTEYYLTARHKCGNCTQGLLGLSPEDIELLETNREKFWHRLLMQDGKTTASLPHCGHCQGKGYTEYQHPLLDVLKRLRFDVEGDTDGNAHWAFVTEVRDE